MNDIIVAGMATMPGREDSLPLAIESISTQVDVLMVYCNFPDVSELSEIYEPPVYFFAMPEGDLKCTGKFWPFFSGEFVGDFYYLGVDDDLIYPPDYAFQMVQEIDFYDRKALCSFHGRLVMPPVMNYYDKLRHEDDYFARKRIGDYTGYGYAFPCLGTVPEDVQVTIVGTGVSGWHTSLFRLCREDFPHPNMEDIYLSKKANDIGAPRYVLAHEEGWIGHIDHEWTIAKEHRPGRDAVQTRVFNEVNWRLCDGVQSLT